MNKAVLILSLAIVSLGMSACERKNKKHIMPQAPIANKIPKSLSRHGDTRIDNYYWLNDREDTAVINYLNAENSYREAMMAHTQIFQKQLFEEIKGRIKQTDESVPYKDNGYMYYTRFEEGKEYPIYCRKNGSMAAAEEVLLNVNELAKGHDYYQVGNMEVSPDNTLLAYGIDTVSRRQYTILVKNLLTGEVYSDAIPNTSASVAWAADGRSFFYTLNDQQTLRACKVMHHHLGEDVSKDKVVFEEKDETFTVDVSVAKSKKYIFIKSRSTVSSEARFVATDTPDAAFTIFQPRERDLEYSIDHFEDKFYIITNLKAKNFQLMETPITQTAKSNWKVVIPHREDVLLEDMEIFKDFLVINERKNGLMNIRIINQQTHQEHYLNFGEETYAAYGSVNPDFDTKVFRYGYTSLTTPNSTYDYDMESRVKTLLKQQEVLGGYDASQYASKYMYATAADGVKVPISVVYKKGTPLDGSAPCLLYGYGSYGYSIDATFSSTRLSLLDRGFVFAIAHIRGGQELGRAWYEDGKLMKKRNTFTDFISCGEFLVAQKYAAKDKLMAMGGSAGGLLMGAVINLRPDLWRGVVAQVPFVDVLTTMLDESIPLTTGEYDEWGNPNEQAAYEYMKSYSPYDNVSAKDYPAMLVTTGLHDSQVQYWEPAKWVAKLREVKTDKNPLYLYCNMETGHGGASGRFDRFKEVALEYAFLLDLLGIEE